MTNEEILQRATRAKILLEDALMVEASQIIERDIVEMWANCPERDIEGQQLLQRHLRDARKLKSILQGVIESGKMVVFQETQRKTVFEQAKNLFRR